MEKDTRNTLRNAVTQMRRLLENSISDVLEGTYGIYASGKIDGDYKMGHLDRIENGRHNREILLGHFEYIKSSGIKEKDAVDQLKREIAFTHLNRLVAFKLMEQRKLIRETVSRGAKSPGVEFYLVEHPEDEKAFDTGDTETAYRNFLTWQAQRFEDEISVLFAPSDPANVVYPPQLVLNEVLELINSDDLADIWTEDETIGWVYQYFTPKELRDKSHRETRSPRNSYEMAFRNQFYTPRYVVEFLTDNTLGRTWYEMHQGDTVLVGHCQYLVRRPNEIFMAKDEEAPELGETLHLSQEELLQEPARIPYRAYKDPRMLNILDPACGSGHFLLYCFDLLVLIYEEAWERDRTDPIGNLNLRRDYPTLDELRQNIPRLVLRHNLHGIDIDRRATQIAALALWLKAQRYYNDHNIKASDRPKITQGNIVLAEPMPGDKTLLKEFTATLNPSVLGQLVERVFDKMQLAGEAGSLLKIEEAIQDDIKQAKKLWETGPTPQQMALFPDLVTKEEYKQRSLFDVSAIDDEQFWGQAEKQVLEALKDYAQQATNGKGLQRRLFAEDAAGGFAFIEVLRKRFDVILMNPPFGNPTRKTKTLVDTTFPNSKGDILANFVERELELLHTQGMLGAISSRTCFYLTTFTEFRQKVLGNSHLYVMADFGDGVLDAMVETASYVLSKGSLQNWNSVFIRCLVDEDKEFSLSSSIEELLTVSSSQNIFISDTSDFELLSTSPYSYWTSRDILLQLTNRLPIEGNVADIKVGLQTSDDFRFLRLIWEVPPSLIGTSLNYGDMNLSEFVTDLRGKFAGGKRWAFYSKTDASSPWISPITLVVDWERDGKTFKEHFRAKGESPSRTIRSEGLYFRPGFSYMSRTTRLVPFIVPSGVIPMAGRSQVFPQEDWEYALLGYCASNVASAIARFSGGSFARPMFQASMIQNLPTPNLPPEIVKNINEYINNKIRNTRGILRLFEPYHDFVVPAYIGHELDEFDSSWDLSTLMGRKLEEQIAESFGLSANQLQHLERDIQEAVSIRFDDDQAEIEIEDYSNNAQVESFVSYCVGVVMGRWDIRYTTGEKPIPEQPDPFDPLPVCPPGMLQNEDGLPATETPAGYPLNIDWDGIMVDDESHPDDIVRRVRDVLHLLWGDNAGKIEDEMLDILGEKSLRSYFQKSSNSGFFMNHVKRYSKSRRKAPIYWYLRSRNGNYGLWLYYHRLDREMLFKALTNYVRPRVQELEHRVTALSGQRDDKQGQIELEAAEDLLNEMMDFEKKLERVTELNLTPDLNDGVVLNIAPLHELVPWDQAQKYWDELLEGKYEWSSIGQQLRKKGLVK